MQNIHTGIILGLLVMGVHQANAGAIVGEMAVSDRPAVALPVTGVKPTARFSVPLHPEPSVVPAISIAKTQDFYVTNSSALAVLVLGTNEDSDAWLALVDGLKAKGIPVTVTRDADKAFQHKVVLVYPYLASMTESEQAALHAHQEQDGTVIAFNAVPTWANSLFGVSASSTGRTHASLAIKVDQGTSGLVRLGCFWATSYSPQGDAVALATYENGTVAALVNPKKNAYLFGVDAGGYISMAENARQSGYSCPGEDGIALTYADHNEPYASRIVNWIYSVYRKQQPLAVTLSPVPEGKSLAVVLTHDIDTGTAVPNAAIYADWEKAEGVPSTYFVQTKYIQDWQDTAYFDESAIPAMAHLLAIGREIGSHSVAHAVAFKNMPLGTGYEAYPGYTPYKKSLLDTVGGTILGELRVSKELLTYLLNTPVVSFRPGYLEYPEALSQAMIATGYQFSSSTTTGDTLSDLPLHMHYSKVAQAEVAAFDFPIAFSDDVVPMLPVLPKAIAVATATSKDKGMFVILIHPNKIDDKLAFEQQFVAAVRPFSWFGSIKDYGYFWAARDEVQVAVSAITGTSAAITVTAPKSVSGLTLELPEAWHLAKSSSLIRSQGTGYAVLNQVTGTVKLSLMHD